MPLWLAILIIASTIGGLLFAAFAMWLKSREKQAGIDTSAGELGQTVAAQQKALEAAERRIQNLEAIVTSQVWDVVHEGGSSEVDKQRALSEARLDLDISEEESSDAERAERMARRLKT